MYPHLPLPYHHVDVFSDTPFAGNGLCVFPESAAIDAAMMQQITQEMRQFESIFLLPTAQADTFTASIFTMEEELGFAGHPVLGAACVIHELTQPAMAESIWHLQLTAKKVTVRTTRGATSYMATMDQGVAQFGAIANAAYRDVITDALSLDAADIPSDYPLQVVSTGLPYLIVPVQQGLERVRIRHPDFAAILATIGARFVYVLDIAQREARTWDNAGLVEDIATGSAAGPAGAYLVKYRLAPSTQIMLLHQGRFVGRPSQIDVRVAIDKLGNFQVDVSGAVMLLGTGTLNVPLPRVLP